MKRRLWWMGGLAVSVCLAVAPVAAQDATGDPLPAAADRVHPILVGTTAPEGPLRAADGSPTTLTAVLAGKPSVLVFYRGHW